MKKIVNLTESDLTRIVRRVIKEQEDWSGVKKDSRKILIMRVSKSTATTVLKRYIKEHKDTVKFIAILDCEGVDVSGINFCEFPDLVLVNLTGTPNNFEETQGGECYNNTTDSMFYFTNE